jgi:hypothetical protein
VEKAWPSLAMARNRYAPAVVKLTFVANVAGFP